MAPSQSNIPPISPQAPISVFPESMSVSAPTGLAGTVVPHTQQTQLPASSMQQSDICPHSVPQQMQPVVIPQQPFIMQQTTITPQTSTPQQQPQQPTQVEQHQFCVQQHHHESEQQIFAQHPVQNVQSTPQQQIMATQTNMEPQALSMLQPGEQPKAYKLQPAGDACEQTVRQSQQLQQQLQQQHSLLQQQQQLLQQQHLMLLERHPLYVQRLDQQQHMTLLQQQEHQMQLQQQKALQHQQILDQQPTSLHHNYEQQQQSLLQVSQGQLTQAQVQQPSQIPSQQQQTHQIYPQTGWQLEGRTQTEPETTQHCGQQQQNAILQLQSRQTQGSEQVQQNLFQQMEQQQALMQQHLQKQFVLNQSQLQQAAQLQHQEKQQVQLEQNFEHLQQQALLQKQIEKQLQQVPVDTQNPEVLHQQAQIKHQYQEQQQQVAINQHSEKQEPVPIPLSRSELQIQPQPVDMQHMCNPELTTLQSTPQTLKQGAIEHKQQAFVAQQQHHTAMETHLSVGVPVSTEGLQHHTEVISQVQVPVTIQTAPIPAQTVPVFLGQQGQSIFHPQNQNQIPAQFLVQSVPQAPQTTTAVSVATPTAVIQGQTQVLQTQQIPLQASYPGSVTPTQAQVTAQPLTQTQPLHTSILQPQPAHDNIPNINVKMMGQQNQATAQPLTADSLPSPVRHETHIQPNAIMQSPLQPTVQQETQGQPLCQGAPMTPQYGSQPPHQALQSVQHNMTHVPQHQLYPHQVVQYQQMVLSPGSVESPVPTTETVDPSVDPVSLHVAPLPVQTGHGIVPGQPVLYSVSAAQQKLVGSSVDSSIIQSISQPFIPQSAEQLQQRNQNISEVHQSPGNSNTQVQLPAHPIQTPTQQPSPLQQALPTLDKSQFPSQCPPTSHVLMQPPAQSGPSKGFVPQSPNETHPLYSHLVEGATPSPQQHDTLLPAHTHTRTCIQAQANTQTQTQVQIKNNSHTQTNQKTPVSEESMLSHAISPAQQLLLSPSCSSTTLPSVLPQQPAPTAELSTSSPVAQVSLPGQATFVPTSPQPVSALQMLDSNAPKLPPASLQDCENSLLGIAQVHEI